MAEKYRTQSHLKLFKNIHYSDPAVKSELSPVLSFIGNLLPLTVQFSPKYFQELSLFNVLTIDNITWQMHWLTSSL